MTKKIKSLLLPLAIIVIGLLIGGGVLLNQKFNSLSKAETTVNNQSLRLLSFKAPGMFCLGCSASIEGYLGAIEGVQSVNASLATKLVGVVYDASIVDKDTILANEILDSYGKEFLSDKIYTGSGQIKTPSTTNLPQELALKLQNAAGLVSKLDNASDYQATFCQIDQAIAQQNYSQAEDLLDELLTKL
jgi:copper chaperone CopZ